MKILPVVLLGLRNRFKEDLNTSAVEMTLRLSVENFAPILGTNHLIDHLHLFMRNIRPRPNGTSQQPSHIHSLGTSRLGLSNCADRPRDTETSVWGPYEVIQRNSELFYKVNVKRVPIERLKPTFTKFAATGDDINTLELRTSRTTDENNYFHSFPDVGRPTRLWHPRQSSKTPTASLII